MGHLGLNFNAINPKWSQIIGDIVVYSLQNFRLIAYKLRPPQFSLFSKNISRLMGRLGLNFIATNLTLSQIIGDIVVYNLWKFQIDSN